jgi:hypothetical protein
VGERNPTLRQIDAPRPPHDPDDIAEAVVRGQAALDLLGRRLAGDSDPVALEDQAAQLLHDAAYRVGPTERRAARLRLVS